MTAQSRPISARTVIGNITLSLDGRVTGPGGEYDMGWIVPHALTDAARDHMIGVTSPATTVLLGRKNYQGFGGFWPKVVDDVSADPRDRAFSKWLNSVEKIVLSSTLKEAAWARRSRRRTAAAVWRRHHRARQRQYHQESAPGGCPGSAEHHLMP